ncbi:MAG: hypothetical protein HKL80_06710 [Acidimicrobiales bacterium]|nr:hypothetical protein [Acidimicrobiales bacterium]
MAKQDISRIFQSILAVLRTANDAHWIQAIEQCVIKFEVLNTETAEYQVAIRDALKLFGGMGTFQDLVLQSEKGVAAEQVELAKLRHELFLALRAELR